MKLFPLGLLLIPLLLAGQARQDAVRLMEQGEAAYREHKLDEALAYASRSIQSDPSQADAYYLRAKIKEGLKDNVGALTDLNICLELTPDQTEVLFSRGLLQYQLARYENARSDFLKVLSLPAGETNTVFYQRSATAKGSNQIVTAQGSMKPLIYNHIGMTEIKLGHYKEALLWLDSAISADRRAADYYVNRGMAREGLKDETGAMADYQKALSIQSNHPIALNNIAAMKRRSGSVNQDELDQAIDSDSSMLNPYLERAYMRMEGGYYKGALDDYSAALRIHDRDPEIWLNRGLVKEKLNDLKGAYSDYTKAIELEESFGKAWVNRGNVLGKLGRSKDAIDDYTAAITFLPDYAVAYYNRSLAYEKLKQHQQACDDLKRAQELGHAVEEKVMKEICK